MMDILLPFKFMWFVSPGLTVLGALGVVVLIYLAFWKRIFDDELSGQEETR